MDLRTYRRFIKKIHFETSTGCWKWRASRDGDGYGQLKIGQRPYKAHRLSYEHFRGRITNYLVSDHLCRHRECVNPWHIEIVTTRENIVRGLRAVKGLRPKKEFCNRGHRFTPDNTYIYPSGARACRQCQRITRTRLF